jgi:hypothetical protein
MGFEGIGDLLRVGFTLIAWIVGGLALLGMLFGIYESITAPSKRKAAIERAAASPDQCKFITNKQGDVFVFGPRSQVKYHEFVAVRQTDGTYTTVKIDYIHRERDIYSDKEPETVVAQFDRYSLPGSRPWWRHLALAPLIYIAGAAMGARWIIAALVGTMAAMLFWACSSSVGFDDPLSFWFSTTIGMGIGFLATYKILGGDQLG